MNMEALVIAQSIISSLIRSICLMDMYNLGLVLGL